MSLMVQRLPPLLSLLVAAVATALVVARCSGRYRSLLQRSPPLYSRRSSQRSPLLVVSNHVRNFLWWPCNCVFAQLQLFRRSCRCCCCEMADDNAGRMFFYVQTCPRAEGCSPGAWKKGRCWDWTEDEARARLVKHLMLSGNHLLDQQEAEEVAEEAVIEQDQWPDPPVPSKKAKLDALATPKFGKHNNGQGAAIAVRSASSSSSGTVTIRREQLQQAIRPISDFAHVPQSPCIF
jgi:hypothetical protein